MDDTMCLMSISLSRQPIRGQTWQPGSKTRTSQ